MLPKTPSQIVPPVGPWMSPSSPHVTSKAAATIRPLAPQTPRRNAHSRFR